MRLCSSRSTASFESTTVTWLSGSRARCAAAVRPTCPAPSISTFKRAPSTHDFQIRVRQHQPLGSLMLEVYLHPGLGTLAFEVQDDTIPEAAMANARAELDSGRRRFCQRFAEPAGSCRWSIPGACHGARHLDAGSHLFHQFLRQFGDEP